ncbi:hypothetical protein [Methylobacterium sp. E-045]|uniref:hypothetical protein n=1 Tax=Methylobacterium sp. E-045 TaxID=2836575 RepID=UPI001FBC0149|nr:hypothetical protein [Methylobacterium sp. E-045]MCJ2130630.1 hypothetical protein [Methylobacterium sp. E-045]
MAYLSEIEPALLKVETIHYLSKICPKKGDDRTLKSVNLDGGKAAHETSRQ